MVDSASYLPAVSIMLAAYGFFFGVYKDRIEAGFDADEAPPKKKETEAAVEAVKAARNTALLLGLVALAVWAIFFGPVVELLIAGFEVGFALSHYDAIDVAFVIAAGAWGVIALILLIRTWALNGKLKKLRKRLAAKSIPAPPAAQPASS